jgi:two-component system, cell cycle sensor histidine kinase and response regulator CckA
MTVKARTPHRSRFRELVEHSADIAVLLGADGTIHYASPAITRVAGYRVDEVVGCRIFDIAHPKDADACREHLTDLVRHPDAACRLEFWLRHKNGAWLAIEAVAVNRLADPALRGMVANLRDITDRKLVAHDLCLDGQPAQEDLRWLILATEQSPASVIVTDLNGVIAYVNPGFTAMTGYAPAEVIGKTPRVLKSGLNTSTAYRDLWTTIRGGRVWRGELCNRRKDGQLYWHSASIAPLKDAHGEVTHFLAVQQDITERVQAEAALRDRESRLRCLIESDIIGTGFWDASGAVTQANDEYLRITGYTQDDVAAGRVNFRTMTPPEYAAADTLVLEQLAAGGTVPPWEKELIRKDGRRVPVLVGVGPLKQHQDQGVVFLLDLTERRALEQQFRQAQKMEAVGRLAGGVAHDFNNMLTAISGYADLLREDLTPGHPGHEDVTEIRKAVDRAAGLTRQLLAFSRQQVLEPRVLDLNELVRNMEKMLRRLLGEDIELITQVDPALAAARADPGQLEQVLMNLAVNSRDAMPDGGSLTIETRNRVVDAAAAAKSPGLKPGRYVTFAIHDTGTGMDQATKARLFEPFFTTKERGKGTGLGLSTVYGIVKQSDGYIEVASELGQGSTFTVYLPHVDESPAASSAAPEPGSLTPRGTETILLAEDDAGVRKIVRETLARAGYTVLDAQDGGEALRLAGMYAGTIALLITDVVMPEVNGRDLATRLVGERPSVRVLYMSGYTDDAALRRAIAEGSSTYLKKPFGPELLLRRVRAALDVAA